MSTWVKLGVSGLALVGVLGVVPGVAQAAESNCPAHAAQLERDRDHGHERGGQWERGGHDRDGRWDRRDHDRDARWHRDHDRDGRWHRDHDGRR